MCFDSVWILIRHLATTWFLIIAALRQSPRRVHTIGSGTPTFGSAYRIERHDETRSHYGNHGARWLLPGGVAAFERVRGPRHHPPRQHVQYFADRSHLSGSQSSRHKAFFASW